MKKIILILLVSAMSFANVGWAVNNDDDVVLTMRNIGGSAPWTPIDIKLTSARHGDCLIKTDVYQREYKIKNSDLPAVCQQITTSDTFYVAVAGNILHRFKYVYPFPLHAGATCTAVHNRGWFLTRIDLYCTDSV